MEMSNLIYERIENRKRMFSRFRELCERIDQLIEALYRPGLYTSREFDEMALEYRVLQLEADRLEEKIRKNYPSSDLDDVLKWLKSHSKDDRHDEESDDDDECFGFNPDDGPGLVA